MTFFSKIGSELLFILGTAASIIVLFFTFRGRYINKGREEAIQEIHGKNIEKLYEGLKDAQDNVDHVRGSSDGFVDELLQSTKSEYNEWGRLLRKNESDWNSGSQGVEAQAGQP